MSAYDDDIKAAFRDGQAASKARIDQLEAALREILARHPPLVKMSGPEPCRCKTCIIANRALIGERECETSRRELAALREQLTEAQDRAFRATEAHVQTMQRAERLYKTFVRPTCGRFQDDAPGLRGECAEKIKQGKPCKHCPESWKTPG